MKAAGRVFLPRGFKFSAASAGIKSSGRPDLALLVADRPATAAALFTQNRMVAAPVEIGRAALERTGGRLRAVIVNSGNANCATGPAGMRACRAICRAIAEQLKISSAEVFPSSTGIIGVPLPREKISRKLRALVETAEASGDALGRFAEAILTTDSRPKLATSRLKSAEGLITGIAKGAGMIHPQLATMLVYLITDVRASPGELGRVLGMAADQSFNLISIEGDTSTNDTVLLMASGASWTKFSAVRAEFESALEEVCRSLARQIVQDGEGVRHVIRLRIEQAKDRAEALAVARTLSSSLLVKTAWAGADPNWGRILAAIGRSGAAVNPRKLVVRIGDQTVCRGATASRFDRHRAHRELSKAESTVSVRLGRGKAALEFLTTDLTTEYVRINADYST